MLSGFCFVLFLETLVDYQFVKLKKYREAEQEDQWAGELNITHFILMLDHPLPYFRNIDSSILLSPTNCFPHFHFAGTYRAECSWTCPSAWKPQSFTIA